jgi:hypothetical protein
MDFFLWGYVKNIVYQVKINELQRPKGEAVATVTPNMLQATWKEADVVPPREPMLKFTEESYILRKRL